MRAAIAALIATLATPGSATACSVEEFKAKSAEFSELFRARAIKDPKNAEALTAKMTAIMQADQARLPADEADRLEFGCESYDAMIAAMR